jgi:hypothetical protein
MKMTVKNWKEAVDAVKEFAAQYGVTAIYWGSGYAVTKPHAVASTLNAWSGEGMGYFVRVYPNGDHDYMSTEPCHMTTIRIDK